VGRTGGEHGDLADPADAARVEEKFLGVATGLLGQGRAMQAVTAVRGLVGMARAGDLSALFPIHADRPKGETER
jgi:hypothetical protein